MPDPKTVRIATWNVWANLGEWRERYPLIAATLRGRGADIVCLQEVWRDAGYDAVADVAGRLGYHYADAVDWFEPMKIHSGAAILSRWPILRSDQFVPPAEHPSGTGLFQSAVIDGPRGRIFAFNAMFAWRPDHSHIRLAQARALGAWIKAQREREALTVLCGDLNAAPDSDEIRALTGLTAAAAPGLVFHDAWAAMRPGSPGHTWSRANPFTRPAALPDRRIDYVLSAWGAPEGLGEPQAAGLLGDGAEGGPIASDHAGVWADLRY
jgi:endonuclease/exonuclease/phosphatase family metal-dependent hydrolase